MTEGTDPEPVRDVDRSADAVVADDGEPAAARDNGEHEQYEAAPTSIPWRPPAVPRMWVPPVQPAVLRSAWQAQQEATAALRIVGPQLALQRSIARSLEPMLQRYSELMSNLAPFAETYVAIQQALAEVLRPAFEAVLQIRVPEGIREAFAAVGRAVADALAPNWPKDTPWSDVLDLIQETGWALVWVPDADVILELLESGDAVGRDEILLEHATEITQTARRRLAEVEDPSLVYLADCALEAADVFDAGYERASQAMCAPVLTGLIESVMGYKLAKARDELEERWEEMSLPMLRYGLIVSTIPSALARFLPGDDVPAKFNRHVVSHYPSPVQLTRVNALAALMLVTALVRELDEIARRGFSLVDEAD